MQFALPKSSNSPIKVIGVGGGGSNAVNTMFEQGIKGVDFVVCNTDAQALDVSPVQLKVQLGSTLTAGMGAGSIPEVGKNAAIENLDDLINILGSDTRMVFVTAGMGGGTGTGAGPVIAKACKELDILTVGIVTVPFRFEGKKRTDQAAEGLNNMREAVDTLLVIRNDKLRELYGNQSISKAFINADQVLCTAAKGIAEVITRTGQINVDMNDVQTVMKNAGNAIMGAGSASGEDRAQKAVTLALESPLLNDNDITGARQVLLNITVGSDEILMDEIMEITDFIQDAAGQSAEVIWGYAIDEKLSEDVCVTVIATGFEAHEITTTSEPVAPKKIIHELGDEAKEVTRAVETPVKIDKHEEETEEQPQADLFSDSETSIELVQETQEDSFEDELVEKDTEDKIIHNLDDATTESGEPEASEEITTTSADAISLEENKQRAREDFLERQSQVKRTLNDVKMKLRLPGRIADLENEPAFKRRNVSLDDVNHSSESSVSHFSINEKVDENGERKIELRDDNPFLHDNVD
ncbi:MAG: cell division protein FtsZ [Crocinitomicaceae bacterium]|nr:cell division protein FtsZ [Crocinitomicaceae bacterium]|tara:strand:+ start:2500 stop:4074 length:1575 start_codon:yes stop_codon:yes gene_type:complete